jgi:enamine deaminase RidA (YjgF/YER057c/UK114 family)
METRPVDTALKRTKMSDPVLPAAPQTPANYELIVIHDKIAYISGQVSRTPDGGVIGGYLQKDDDLEQARSAAQVSLYRALAVLKEALGDLDQVERVISLKGFICAAPDFVRHPQVLDAASELLHQVFGPRGAHVRTALGVSSIPGGGLTELELVVAVR